MRSIKFINHIGAIAAIAVLFSACAGNGDEKKGGEKIEYQPGSFGYDLEFVDNYQQTLVLKRDEAMVMIVPAFQGRVMTSTANGSTGKSLGWINYKLIESGENAPHFNNYGGEERFWMGPEGGQFSIFFPQGSDFVFDNWQVPAVIDTDAYQLVDSNDTMALFRHEMAVTNYSGFEFSVKLERSIKLLDMASLAAITGVDIPSGLSTVAYESVNTISNSGDSEWTTENGLLSIWILGQFISTPDNTVIVPYVEGPEEELGPIVNDSYFGKVPDDRLAVSRGIIFFKADGMQRGKIGLSPSRAKNFIGSYDSGENLLTLVYYNKPDTHEGYVNSMWEIQDEPFGGDVINSYNDGPLEDGSQLGPFYELETSSMAAALEPGGSLTHKSTTIHVGGSKEDLNKLINKIFNISTGDIKNAFIQKN
jgi:hypothetical protein